MTVSPPLKLSRASPDYEITYYDLQDSCPPVKFKEAVAVQVYKSDASKIATFLSQQLPLDDLPCMKRFKPSPQSDAIFVLLGSVESISSLPSSSEFPSDTLPSTLTLNELKSLLSSLKTSVSHPFFTLHLSCNSYHTKTTIEELKRTWPLIPKLPPDPSPNSILPETLTREEEVEVFEVLEKLVGEINQKGKAVGLLRDSINQKDIITVNQSEHVLGHVSIELINKFSSICSVDSYFLSNLDVFLLHEPCVFCTMALIHSRVRRLWFCQSHSNGGVSQFKVPYSGVNHKMYCAMVGIEFGEFKCKCLE
ncbi:hypothetical protein P9112_008074 [Eukaryota sp. TZLM1-RC]